MAKKKVQERTYAFWEDFREDWTRRAIRSFQIQTCFSSKASKGREIIDLPIDTLSKKISGRSLDNITLSMPPIVDHFTEGKEEVFTTAVLHDAKYNKKSKNVIISYALNIRYGKKNYHDIFVAKEFIDNDNYEAIEGIVEAMSHSIADVYNYLDKYFPMGVK